MTTPDINPALIAGLAVEAEKLSQEGQRLSDELHARGVELHQVAVALTGALDALAKYRRLVAALAVVAVFAMAGLGVIAALNLRNGHIIKSCTTPGGSCWERSQQQTGEAISRLVLAFCSGLYPHDAESAQQCGVAALKALR